MLYKENSPFNFYTDNIVFHVPVNMTVKELSIEVFGKEQEVYNKNVKSEIFLEKQYK